MFFVRIGIILGQGEIMGTAQDDHGLADACQLPKDCFQCRMGIGQSRPGPNIPRVGQSDIRVPAKKLIELFADDIGGALFLSLSADPSFFLTAYDHQVGLKKIREEFIVSIDLFTDLPILISLIL